MSEDDSPPATRLVEVRQARGLKQAQLARLSGVDASTLNKYETGSRNLTPAYKEQIADALGVPSSVLFEKIGLPIPALLPPTKPALMESSPPFNAKVAIGVDDFPPKQTMKLTVPVFGTAQGGADGAFQIDLGGSPVDWARRPDSISAQTQVFAIYVQGESMVPWRQPGELVYVHEHRPPAPGNHVIVLCCDGEGATEHAFVKRLVRRTNAGITLEQYNPKLEFLVPAAQIKRVYRVLEWSELLST